MATHPAVHATAAVSIENLHVKRGKFVVFEGLNLEIPRGEITGLLGPSGCGKTTLMRTIVGVQRVQSGKVVVLDAAAGSSSLRHRVSYDTQDASVYDDLTVQQNLDYFARVLKVPRAQVTRVIDRVGLRAQAKQLVSSLSGGQHNRASLAVALLGAPELIVLDEPTVGLDPALRAELWALFREIAAEGTTLIISSHVMDEAQRCDRLVLMREGCIVADTTPRQLLIDTQATDPDTAFLTLIRREASGVAAARAMSPEQGRSEADHPEHGGAR